MDIKSMLMDMAEAQADKMRDEAVGFLGSEQFEKEVASKINEKSTVRSHLHIQCSISSPS